MARFTWLVCSLMLACSMAYAGSAYERLGKLFSNGDVSAPDETEILDPETAFVLSAEVTAVDTINVRWDIVDGYYLYRDKFNFALPEGAVLLGPVSLPPGELKQDPEFGDVEVYHRAVEVALPIQRTGVEAVPLELSVTYQGCKENTVCYPPVNKIISLLLPAAVAAPANIEPVIGAADESPQPLSSQDRITENLRQGGVWLNVLVFLGFGLLLAFTPCVFPMVPILSGIIVGHGKTITTQRAFLLSLVYVLMMALTYAILGVIAGSFALNLQTAAQNPWVISAFSLVFVILALSMFGFYELQLPHSWQGRLYALANRQQRGHLMGAGVMGFLSAIIVGPCVAPPLAGTLIYISQTGNAVLGGAALFALGLGMGLPLLVIGTSTGKLLPRAGAWMETVKNIFGVLMLAVAIWFMSRVLPGPATLFLWGMLAVVTALYMGALDTLPAGADWQKLWKGIGIVMLVYGVVLIIGAASGGNDALRPLQAIGIQAARTEALRFERIENVDDLDRMLAEAEWKNQPVLLNFYAGWCPECNEIEKYTFSKPEVQAVLQNIMLLKADVTAGDEQDRALLQHFGIFGPPAMLFFVRGEERKDYRLIGFVAAGDLITHIKQLSAL